MIPEENSGIVLLFNPNCPFGDPFSFQVLTRGVTRLVTGRGSPPAHLSLLGIYMIGDLLAVLGLTYLVGSLVRLLIGMDPRGRIRRGAARGSGVLTLLDLFLALALLQGVPLLFSTITGRGMTLSLMAMMQPDVTALLILFAALLALRGIARAILVIFSAGVPPRDPRGGLSLPGVRRCG